MPKRRRSGRTAASRAFRDSGSPLMRLIRESGIAPESKKREADSSRVIALLKSPKDGERMHASDAISHMARSTRARQNILKSQAPGLLLELLYDKNPSVVLAALKAVDNLCMSRAGVSTFEARDSVTALISVVCRVNKVTEIPDNERAQLLSCVRFVFSCLTALCEDCSPKTFDTVFSAENLCAMLPWANPSRGSMEVATAASRLLLIGSEDADAFLKSRGTESKQGSIMGEVLNTCQTVLQSLSSTSQFSGDEWAQYMHNVCVAVNLFGVSCNVVTDKSNSMHRSAVDEVNKLMRTVVQRCFPCPLETHIKTFVAMCQRECERIAAALHDQFWGSAGKALAQKGKDVSSSSEDNGNILNVSPWPQLTPPTEFPSNWISILGRASVAEQVQSYRKDCAQRYHAFLRESAIPLFESVMGMYSTLCEVLCNMVVGNGGDDTSPFLLPCVSGKKLDPRLEVWATVINEMQAWLNDSLQIVIPKSAQLPRQARRNPQTQSMQPVYDFFDLLISNLYPGGSADLVEPRSLVCGGIVGETGAGCLRYRLPEHPLALALLQVLSPVGCQDRDEGIALWESYSTAASLQMHVRSQGDVAVPLQPEWVSPGLNIHVVRKCWCALERVRQRAWQLFINLVVSSSKGNGVPGGLYLVIALLGDDKRDLAPRPDRALSYVFTQVELLGSVHSRAMFRFAPTEYSSLDRRLTTPGVIFKDSALRLLLSHGSGVQEAVCDESSSALGLLDCLVGRFQNPQGPLESLLRQANVDLTDTLVRVAKWATNTLQYAPTPATVDFQGQLLSSHWPQHHRQEGKNQKRHSVFHFSARCVLTHLLASLCQTWVTHHACQGAPVRGEVLQAVFLPMASVLTVEMRRTGEAIQSCVKSASWNSLATVLKPLQQLRTKGQSVKRQSGVSTLEIVKQARHTLNLAAHNATNCGVGWWSPLDWCQYLRDLTESFIDTLAEDEPAFLLQLLRSFKVDELCRQLLRAAEQFRVGFLSIPSSLLDTPAFVECEYLRILGELAEMLENLQAFVKYKQRVLQR